MFFGAPARLFRVRMGCNQEAFTVQVFYDTQELYGKVSASRTITLSQK